MNKSVYSNKPDGVDVLNEASKKAKELGLSFSQFALMALGFIMEERNEPTIIRLAISVKESKRESVEQAEVKRAEYIRKYRESRKGREKKLEEEIARLKKRLDG